MKTRVLIPLLVVALSSPLGLCAQGWTTDAGSSSLRCTLPAGTPIVLAGPDSLPAGTAPVLRVAEAVAVDNHTLIAAGTPVQATVQATDPGGADTTVWFTIEYIEAVDGRLVFVNPRSFPLRTPGQRWTTRVKNKVTIVAPGPGAELARMR